jgi:superfamily II DNA or RNA helicase
VRPPPPVHAIDDELLTELYDPGAMVRGRTYALEGRVQALTSSPGSLRAVCRGSGRHTYLVRVRWHDSGRGIYLDDDCSCPLGGQCKHCVATIVEARRQAVPLDGVGALGPRGDWRQELTGLASLPAHEVMARGAALGLQFSVAGPPSRYGAGLGERVMFHPVRQGKNGRWVKGGASWRDLASPYSPTGATFDARQVGALRALAASGKLSYYSGAATVTLDQFGPDVWDHLDRAVEVGIALISADAHQQVELVSERGRPQVEVRAEPSSAIAIAAVITIDGTPLTTGARSHALVGNPPHGMWLADDHRLRLVPFEHPLHPTVARLVHAPPLVVPAADTDELLDDYLPALGHHATVISPNGTVTIETSRFDRLLLVVTRSSLDTADVVWHARYRRGDKVVDHPLHRPAARSRDAEAEAVAIGAVDLPTHQLADLADPDGRPRDLQVRGRDAIVLLGEVVPWLEERAQLDVEVRGDLPVLRAALEDPQISLSVRDASTAGDNTDWFDLAVTVTVGGEEVDFVTLFTALHRGEEVLILPSGTWLHLDRREFAKLRALLEEARALSEPSGIATTQINRFQSSWWDELASLGVVAEQSERWARSIGQVAQLEAPEPVAPPAGLAATLRPYQQEGLDWLAFLHRNELGGILADDMGLGKTIQTLALCLHVHDRQPDARFLVVAPTSVVENWAREAARFAPDLTVRTVHETQSRRGTTLAEEIAGASLVVTSYALFRLEFDQYQSQRWEILLVDEAQFVKNHQGKTYQCVRRLDATTKVAITGTPLENSLMDLWSLLSIAAPGLYPDPKRFSETYRKPIENGTAPELLGTLRRRIAPLMRRRTKDAVLTELPPKIEQTVEIELSSRHARLYAAQLQRQRQKVLGLVGDVHKHRFEILKSLTLLRQLALDPALVDEDHDTVGSAKLDRLIDDLGQVIAEGHRALVFSQFTRFLARVRDRLDAADIAHAYLDGRTRKRDVAIDTFKRGDVPVFVISLKAGGVGLNLTEADYCFVLDPWWNPATETQAVDRTHRIGQRNPVVVYRYVSTNTIEEKVMELKARKANLFDRVVGEDGALAGALTEADIRGLLGIA